MVVGPINHLEVVTSCIKWQYSSLCYVVYSHQEHLWVFTFQTFILHLMVI